ncbi:MAG: hypothetical protein HOP07_01845 [Bacteriovoracaceae bacterium]|nr:hypothetical protein [Bacteriovoracaceae bacterium]
MKSFESVNKLINEKLSFPIKVTIKCENQEYNIENDEIKIALGDIFYFSSNEGETLVAKENIFSMLNINEITILNMQVDELNILKIECKECIILGFPREYEGWGIYVKGKQFAAHYGWQNDLDWE